ncbi:ribose-5-phosphate isomerase [Corynebacterium glucuronolyticum]
MHIYLGADHAGYEAKEAIKAHLIEAGYEVTDCGAHEYDAQDDYPVFCIAAAEAVAKDPGSLGFVLGGSGNGEQMAANKVKGIRCALGWNEDTARLARAHNNAQVLSIGGRQHSEEEVLKLVDAFLDESWSEEERHQRRIDILAEYEKTGVAPEVK